MNATKHLLRWKGRQSGPFAPDEIRTLLKSSEIGLMHEVQAGGVWITVERFLAQAAPRPPAAPAPKLEKKAPAPKLEVPKSPPAPIAPPLPLTPETLPPLLPRLPAEPAPWPHLPRPTEAAAEEASPDSADETLAFGGFWLRLVAAGIDGVILSALSWAVAAIALVISGGSRAAMPPWLMVLVMAIYLVGSWLYCALMESSDIQSTLGKLAVGLIVTDLDGGRLTFTHATGRYFGKLLSTLTLGAGFFMAAFTERKQALHDMITGCYVLLRLPPARIFQP